MMPTVLQSMQIQTIPSISTELVNGDSQESGPLTCSECGYQNSEGAAYCGDCGRWLGREATFEESDEQEELNLAILQRLAEDKNHLAADENELAALYSRTGCSLEFYLKSREILRRIKAACGAANGEVQDRKSVREGLQQLEKLLATTDHHLPADKQAAILQAIKEFEDPYPVLSAWQISVWKRLEDRLIEVWSDKRSRELTGLLWNLVQAYTLWRPAGSNKTTRLKDVEACTEMILEEARVYRDSDWMHAPWLGNFILAHLVESCSALVKSERQKALPLARGYAILVLVGVVGVSMVSFGLGAMSDSDSNAPWHGSLEFWSLFGFVFAGVLLAVVAVELWELWREWRRTKAILGKLDRIQSEVPSDSYDVDETLRRLREVESLGFRVPGLVYSMVELRERTT